MTKIITFIVCFAFFSSILANELPIAKVIKVKGNVLFEGQKLKLNDEIKNPGTIELKEKSFVQIKIEKWNNVISITENSKMNLNFNNEKVYTLEGGTCRWKTFLKDKIVDKKGKIFTKNSSLGVRGTDFILIYNQIFNESEIVMLDGEVELKNEYDHNDKINLIKGQWGGIGGRFGQKIAPVINLSEEALTHFKRRIE